jgi:hypothetical protein
MTMIKLEYVKEYVDKTGKVVAKGSHQSPCPACPALTNS